MVKPIYSAILFSAVLSFSSCKETSTTDTKQDSKTNDSTKVEEPIKDTKKVEEGPIFGHRFIIKGDFDGDGQQEKLIEHFQSGIDKKETSKSHTKIKEYFELIEYVMEKQPYSFVTSDNTAIDTLKISEGGQVLGLSFLKNEGDLNNDGIDDISYVVNWADQSNLNTWKIATYKKGEWKTLYSFDIWDWQLPALPDTFVDEGIFGLNTSQEDVNKDSIAIALKKYRGLVKPIKKNKVQVTFRNEMSMEDSVIVKIKK